MQASLPLKTAVGSMNAFKKVQVMNKQIIRMKQKSKSLIKLI